MKQQLLEQLLIQMEEYSKLSIDTDKKAKRTFINGYMTACRVAGVSFEELEAITSSIGDVSASASSYYMDIPTFKRLGDENKWLS